MSSADTPPGFSRLWRDRTSKDRWKPWGAYLLQKWASFHCWQWHFGRLGHMVFFQWWNDGFHRRLFIGLVIGEKFIDCQWTPKSLPWTRLLEKGPSSWVFLRYYYLWIVKEVPSFSTWIFCACFLRVSFSCLFLIFTEKASVEKFDLDFCFSNIRESLLFSFFLE